MPLLSGLPALRRRLPPALTLTFLALSLGSSPALATTSSLRAAGAPASSESPAPKLTEAPTVKTFVQAQVPPGKEELQAAVILQILIDATGKVTQAQVTKSAGEDFDRAAIAAVLQFEFTPAKIDDKPSPIRIAYRYDFVPQVVTPPPTTTATITGIIRRGDTHAPVYRATVRVLDEQGRSATTDAAGRFYLDGLSSLALRLQITGPGLPTVELEEALQAGQELEVAYEVTVPPPPPPTTDQDDLELVVVAPPVRRELVAMEVRAQDARKVPGTSGDVLRVVETMPGVGRAAAGSGQVIVWGAGPQDSQVYVDGVPIPRLYHEGGLRSLLAPQTVSSLALHPGGYGVAFGRGLGGIVDVRTHIPDANKVKGQVAADILDASGSIIVPTGKHGRAMATARVGYLRAWATPLVSKQARALVPIPAYGDGQLRFNFKPSADKDVDVVFLVGADEVSRGVLSDDPSAVVNEARRMDFQRGYVRLTHRASNGQVLTVTPFVGRTASNNVARVGATATSLADTTWIAGVRADHQHPLRSWLTLRSGLDTLVSHHALQRRGSLGLPAREGDLRVFGQPPPDQVAVDSWKVTQVNLAGYFESEFRLWKDRLRIVPGLRVDPDVRAVSRGSVPLPSVPNQGLYRQDFSAQPRLSMDLKLGQRVSLRALTGLYQQAPAATDLSAAFGTPALHSAKAFHAVLGATVRATSTLTIELTGFITQSRHLAMRSASASPLVAQALTDDGEGRVHGGQLLVRQELFKGLFGWVTYALMRAQRRDHPGMPWRLSDYDQTHVLNAVLSYQLPWKLEISGRVRVASGFPRTEVIGAYFDASRKRYQPVFGEHNGDRIAPFVQVDARLARPFAIGSTKLEVFIDVFNALNRQNPEEWVYSGDFRSRGVIAGLPLIPSVGAQWDF